MKEEQKKAAEQFLNHIKTQIIENNVDIKRYEVAEFSSHTEEAVTVHLSDKIIILITRVISN